MLGWMIIFAILSILGLLLGIGERSSSFAIVTASYGFSALFGALFAFTALIRRYSRHSS